MTNSAVKDVLVIAAKNAVNALLTSSAFMAMMSGAFNIHSTNGWWNLGKAALGVVGAREAMVWIPRLLKWSQSNGDGDSK